LESKLETKMDVNLVEPKYNDLESDREETEDKKEKEEEEEEEGDNDSNENNDIENGSSDEPLIKCEQYHNQDKNLMIKKEQNQEREKNNERSEKDMSQKLKRANKEMRETIYQMATKIEQLGNYRDITITSLRKQLHKSNQRADDAESKNFEHEAHIRNLSDEKEKNKELIEELNIVRTQLSMLQKQIWDNFYNFGSNGNSNSNSNSNNVASSLIHSNQSLQPVHGSYSSSQQMSAMSAIPPLHGLPMSNNTSNFHMPPLTNYHINHNNSMNSGNVSDVDITKDLGWQRMSSDPGSGWPHTYGWSYNNGNEEFGMPLQPTVAMNVDSD